MHRPSALLGAGLLFTLACGASSTSPDRPLNHIAADGGFLGWTLGAPFEPDPARFEVAKRASEHQLRDPVTVGGRLADRVTFESRDGALAEVEIAFFARGQDQASQLLSWGENLCAPFTERVEWLTPSPLGTPEPGETWDPVQTSNASCSGDAHGVHYRISLQRSSASDFHNGNVTVRLQPRSGG